MISQVLIKLLGLAYKMYLTNKEGFGDKGNAIYSSGFQIYALLLTLSSIGVPNAISKIVSEKTSIGDNKGAHQVFKVCFVTYALIGLAGTLLLFFSAKYIANSLLQIPEAELTLASLSPSIFFVSISSVIRGYFNGRKELRATAHSQTIEQAFKAVLTILLVQIIGINTKNNTIIMAAGANVATTLATFIGTSYLYLYYKSRRKEVWTNINLTANYSPQRIKNILKNILAVSIPITISALLGSLNKNIDAITVVRGLKTFLTEAEAKIQYGILSGKIDTLIMLPLSFNIAFSIALVPTISSLIAKKDYKTAKKKIKNTIIITATIGIICTLGMSIFAKQILEILFPNAPQGEILLRISAVSIIFILLTQTMSGALQGLGKVMIPAISIGTGVIIKLILNIILIPMPNVGIYGAAIGSAVCHMVSCIIESIVIIKIYIKKKDFSRIWRNYTL